MRPAGRQPSRGDGHHGRRSCAFHRHYTPSIAFPFSLLGSNGSEAAITITCPHGFNAIATLQHNQDPSSPSPVHPTSLTHPTSPICPAPPIRPLVPPGAFYLKECTKVPATIGSTSNGTCAVSTGGRNVRSPNSAGGYSTLPGVHWLPGEATPEGLRHMGIRRA
jgi:hypothetical protein